jgi:hypothetical protein
MRPSRGSVLAPVFGEMGPQTLTLLPTYQCTASCAGCCFGSHPGRTGRMSLGRIQDAIDVALAAFPTLSSVVFSGGECFLLRDDLRAAVAHASSRRLGTRCVTNGYWATSPRGVRHHLEPLIDAGLLELNLSTGDAHQAYVPWSNVLRAAIASAEAGLTTMVAIEMCRSSRFTIATAYADPLLKDFMSHSPARGRLALIQSQWVDGSSAAARPDPGLGPGPLVRSRRIGCDNLFDNIVFTPDGSVLGCCGLTANDIPEMRLGPFVADARQLRALYRSQFSDFGKLWLWLDGPRQVCAELADLASVPGVAPLAVPAHPCEACMVLYRSAALRGALRQHYISRLPDVLFRLSLRSRLTPPALRQGAALTER